MKKSTSRLVPLGRISTVTRAIFIPGRLEFGSDVLRWPM